MRRNLMQIELALRDVVFVNQSVGASAQLTYINSAGVSSASLSPVEAELITGRYIPGHRMLSLKLTTLSVLILLHLDAR